jgi:ureidoglycolate hydrolase
MIHVQAEPLDAASFAPFGAVIAPPVRAHDASGPGWTWWAENELLAASDRGYGVGYLDLEPAESSFDWAERHMRSQELIAPLDGCCLVYVGPADSPEQPDALPPLDRFRVFVVEPGQAVLLAAGVWHGAPLSESPSSALVLLLEGTGRDDVTVVRFEDDPVAVEA